MLIQPDKMCSPQPARSNSEKIPLSRVKQRRMRTFTFMTAPLLASAAMFITTLSVPSASGTTLNGMVQTGDTCSTQPLPHVQVRLFEATTGQPTVIGQATTDAFGHFSISSPNVCSFPGSSRRELVDATVVVIAAVNCGPVEVSKRINDHPVIPKTAIGRTMESVNYSFGPLT